MLIRDEVVYSKQWNLMYGLVPERPELPVAVGGIHQEHSVIRYDEKDGFPQLKQEYLASLNVSTVLKPVNSRSGLWQIQQLPRGYKTDKVTEFMDIGELCMKCCEQNSGLPPSVIAYDGHGVFEAVNAALLGLLPEEDMESKDFWSACQPKLSVSLPLFSCKALYFGDTPVFGSLDPKHCQKAA